MTVATQETYIEYAGDNSSTVFALDFPFVDATCLKAVKIDGNGVSTPVTITDTTGGSQRTGWGVTISAPVGTGYTLRIYRDTPMVQPKVYTENDPFPGRSHEIGLDRLTMIVQELRSGLISGEFSSNPATFVQGLELTLTGSLLPGQIGFATDRRALLLKLQDGTIVRIPVDGPEAVDTWGVKYFNANYSDVDEEPSVGSYVVFPEQSGQFSVFGSDEFDPATGVEMRCDGYFKAWPVAHAFGFVVLILDKNGTPKIIFSSGASGEYRLQPTPFWHTVRVFPSANSLPEINVYSFDVEATYRVDPATEESHTSWLNQTAELLPKDGPFRIALAIACGGSSHHARLENKIVYSKVSIAGASGGAQLIGTAGGDLSGTYPNPTVVGIRGESVPSLTAGFLSYTGTEWAFAPLSAFDFVKRPGDSMTGKLEFKDGEGDTNPGSIEKTVGMGFNYLDIQQAGINANIQISTEDNVGNMTEKINVGPNGVDLKESIFIQDELAIGAAASFLTPYVDFRNQAEPDQVKGRTFWDESNGTLTTMLRDSGGPDTKLQHGQEIMIPCFNDTGVTIPSFRAVYIAGSQGDKLKIALADPTDPAKTQVIGVTTESIADQEVGFVTFFGEVRNENTAAFTDGQEGFLSSAGGVIGTTVAAGDARVRIGYCRRSHASVGAFFVAPMRYPMASDIVIDVWEDMPFLRGSKVGASAPTYAQFGATAFWGWKMASGNIFYHDDGQINHKWNLEAIRPHLHFSSDNGGTGSVTFEHRIMSRPASGGAWSAEVVATKSWTGTLAAGAGAPVLDLYVGDGFLPASPGPSTLIKAVLTMTAKTFTGNIFIDGWDAHYKLNRLGTPT